MSYTSTLRGTVAVAAMLAATAAHAELTGDAVWQSWQDYAAQSGQSMTAESETRDGDALILDGVTISSNLDDVIVTARIGEITFVEEGDGTVGIVLPARFSVSMTSEDGEDGLVLGVSQPGLELAAGETATGIGYALRAPEMTITVDEVMGDDAPETLDITMAANGIVGSYDIPTDAAGPTTADLRSAAINFTARVLDEAADVDADISASISGGAMEFSGTALALMDDDDPMAALREGFGFDLATSHESLRYSFMVDERGERMEASGGAVDGEFRFALDGERLALSTANRNAEITVASDDIPFPAITLTAAETAFGFAMPLSGGDEPQDVSLTTRIIDLGVTEEVWAMFDPMEQLPRTPATVVLDLSAEVLLGNDLYSEETAMGVMMAGPDAAGELVSAALNELNVSFAGARLTGDGAFTFDYTDRETFDGVPRPTGAMELALRGGNTLLDTLVEMGMVPEEEAMGARMMLALFTRPGETEDELLTTLEVRDDGAVLANGQRLQ